MSTTKELPSDSAKRLKVLAGQIEKHESKAKEFRIERDQIILAQVTEEVSVSAVAEAAGVTRQHIYKNIIGDVK